MTSSLFVVGVVLLAIRLTVEAPNPYNHHFMDRLCAETNETSINLTRPELYSYGFLQVLQDGNYPPDFYCKVFIVPSTLHHLGFRIRWVDIYKTSSKPCVPDSMNLLGTSDGSENFEFCGTGTPSAYYIADTKGEVTSITFRSGADTDKRHHRGFELYYTSFTYPPCKEGEFRCWYFDHCIPSELTCDGYDNCGDWSDERVATCGMSTGGIVALSLISALLLCTCFVAIVYQVSYRDGSRSRRNRRNRRTAAAGDTVMNTASVSYSRSRGGAEHSAEPPPPYLFTDEKPALPSYENFAYGVDDLPPPQYQEPTNPMYARAPSATTPNTPAVDQPQGGVQPIYPPEGGVQPIYPPVGGAQPLYPPESAAPVAQATEQPAANIQDGGQQLEPPSFDEGGDLSDGPAQVFQNKFQNKQK